jgi:hypothetical protein
MTTQSNILAVALADKLLSEGERTLAYFAGLADDVWAQPLYVDGARWTVRGAFEHLILSEESLLRLFRLVAAGGQGAPEGVDIDGFNAEATGQLAGLSRAELLARCAAARRETADFARGLSDAQLAARGRHPALGEAALEEMLKLIYVHHSMHARDVRRLQR